MKYKINQVINCDKCDKCHTDIINKLEKKFNCVLMAKTKISNVNGSVSILHKKGNHHITVEFYEKNENNKDGSTKFIKLSSIPTLEQVKKAI